MRLGAVQRQQPVHPPAVVPAYAPEFIQTVTAPMMAGLGDMLPVSALPIDGTYPTGTTKWEKRNIATRVPIWDEEICIQCGKCAFVCPHAVIRLKIYDPDNLQDAPEGFKSVPARFKGIQGSGLYVCRLAGRLHGLFIVLRSLPGQEQAPAKIQGHQYGRLHA